VQWFAEAVLPLIRASLPDVRFVIVGSKPTEDVLRLKQQPGIEVTGFVEDVRVYVAAAALCVVPLKIARGLQNKVLEAMAMGKAVVCTAQSLEGIRASDGVEVVVANEAADFAAQVVSLIGQPERCEELGRQARRCMERGYSWEANLRQLDALLGPPAADACAAQS
jgi:glycosyltransferase involved in cell wall biosynthesis